LPPNSEPRYRAHVYLAPNCTAVGSGAAGLAVVIPNSLPNTADYDMLVGISGSTKVFRVQVRYNYQTGVCQVLAQVRSDGTNESGTTAVALSNAVHYLEVDWKAATTAGANNGYLSLWLDGNLLQTLSSIDNDTRRVDEVRLGAVAVAGSSVDPGPWVYFDAFESRRSTYLGPITTTTVVTYTYDPLYRLTNAAYSGAYTTTFTYGYDKVGNRTIQTRTITSTQVITYQYDNANRMTKAGGVTYIWDNNGNLINDGSATYLYDRANRLISTTLSGVTSQYSYNGDGTRLRQIIAGVPTTYTQDLAAPLLVVLQSKTGVTTTKYLYSLGTRPVAQNTTAWEYLLPDALGSVRQIADASGNVTLAKSYEPYGSVLSTNGSASSIFAYAGEQIDTTGLIYLRARYMNPRLGIFLARDPWSGDVLRPGSMNGWNYTEGNPVNRVDPKGEYIKLPCWWPNRLENVYSWSEGHREVEIECVGPNDLPPVLGTTLPASAETNPAGAIIVGGLIVGYICLQAIAQPRVQPQTRSEPRAEPTVIPWPIERIYPTEEPKARPPVVVQLQEGFTHHDSRQLKDFGGGVTVAQVVGALTELLQHPNITKKYKSWAEVAYSNAVAWTMSRPPYGAPPNFPKGQSFPFPKYPDWRFDIVIYVGQQLRR
jgi:RHS repeat-associated protein